MESADVQGFPRSGIAFFAARCILAGVATAYDLIVIGTGSAMNLVGPFIRRNPKARIAVIDKDKPGGICLTRGCIPTKLLTTAADVVVNAQRAGEFGVDVEVRKVDFAAVMARMHRHIDPDIEGIRQGLSKDPNIDYFHEPAAFTAPYTLRVGSESIRSKTMLLCAGSKPLIPPIEGVEDVKYHTTDTILDLKDLPRRVLITGGGYIAAEFGHFFAAMGSDVTIIGRNPRFLAHEDEEISAIAANELGKRVKILTGTEVKAARRERRGVVLTCKPARGKQTTEVAGDLLLVASGRASNWDTLKPDKGGIKTDAKGWIQVDDFLETNQKGVWALGDCLGRYQFKHVANYESMVVYQNAFLGRRVKPDYHAVPRAVFTDPEIAGVGLTEAEARERHPPAELLVGRYRFMETAKGAALNAESGLAKVIVHAPTRAILGAHVIGPQASVLVQEVISVMNTPDRTFDPIVDGMHIHPALSEVVERAFGALRPVDAAGLEQG